MPVPDWSTRVRDLLWATGWKPYIKGEANPLFAKSWGMGPAVVISVKNGKFPSIRFVQRLIRLEQMYAEDLRALHNGEIMVSHNGTVRYDLRKGESALRLLGLDGGAVPSEARGMVSSLAAQGLEHAAGGAEQVRRPDAERRRA